MSEDRFYSMDYWLHGEDLINWITHYLVPNDKWVIEISGGEPTVHPHLEYVLKELHDHNYFTVVKTNGSKDITKYDTQIIVGAWHKDKPFPKTHDCVLIIRNPEDNWEEKVKYCENNHIVYKTQCLATAFKNIPTNRPDDEHPVNHTIGHIHINSSGEITPCQTSYFDHGVTIFTTKYYNAKPIYNDCPTCIAMADVEKFLPQWLMDKFIKDYNDILEQKKNVPPAHTEELKESLTLTKKMNI